MKKLKKLKLKISLKQAVFCSAFMILFVLNCFLIYQNVVLKKTMKSEIDNLTQNIELSLLDYSQKVDQNILEVKMMINEMSENQSDQFSGVKRNLNKMNNTYGSILEEEKKQRIDVSAKDNEIISIKKEALQNYTKGNFKLAYEGYKTVLTYVENDLEARNYKMKSLFKLNKANKSTYQEILKDLDILKMNGYADEESLEIGKIIQLEMEGLNE